MDAKQESCLIAKFSHYVDLNAEAEAHLRDLEKNPKYFGAGEEVYAAGDSVNDLHVVKYGWAYGYMDFADGRRQIVKIYHPGDIIGFPDIGLARTTMGVRMAEAVCLCPFPKQGLNVIFRESPVLTALVFAFSVRDQAQFIDMMCAMGRMSARQRLGYLLLDLIARLRITNRSMTDTIRMPLTQTELGDTLGLTNVHISKTLSGLEKDGYISRGDHRVTIRREADLAAMCDFVNRHDTMDTAWFPQ